MSVFVKTTNNNPMRNKSKRFSIFKEKAFRLTLLMVLLGIILVGTSVLVSKKTYEVIGLQKQIEKLQDEQKDLNEDLDSILSPLSIRKRAAALGMVDIKNIEEMITIAP